MIKKFFKQKGVSLTEALVAIFVSTVVMGATYAIYANFQGTFVRQINYNNLKQEARFALHVLQHDSRMAGFKHERSTFGEVQIPVKVLNDDGTEVSDDTEFGETVMFCFDTEPYSADSNNPVAIQRKLIRYELQLPFTSATEKTTLKKKIWNTPTCDPNDANATVDVDWVPVAQFFKTMGIRLRSKHIDFEVQLETTDDKIRETYTASSYMRNLNFGGSNYYVYNEEDLHENRTAVLPFTGSLKVNCSSKLTLDLQTSNFLGEFKEKNKMIVLHQGETVGGTSLTRTYPLDHADILYKAEKPPAIIGIPSLSQDEMRLKLTTTTTSSALPPGLSLEPGYIDANNNDQGDAGEWDGTIKLSGTLESADTNYTFNSDGYQDFTIRLKADLDTNCDGLGWNNQNEAYKDYKVRVMKFSAPQFSDVNLHTWEARGFNYGDSNYEKRGTQSYNGGPFYDKTEDGRSFYVQQNLASPSFLVSKDNYDSFVLKGTVCSGGYPDCNPTMRAWLDDDMLGFAAGLQRPNIPHKVWEDKKIRACAGVNYKGLNKLDTFSETRLRNSLRTAERNIWNNLSTTEKESWFGEPADMVYDMYLFSWWGAESRKNRSALHLHQYKGYEHLHIRNCGYPDGTYSSHQWINWITGWDDVTPYINTYFAPRGYNRLFYLNDNTRPTNTGSRNCYSNTTSYSRISFNPGATHRWNCSWGKDAGVKNMVTLTYHPNKFRVNIENKPNKSNTDSQRFTAFDLRFNASGVLKKHTSTSWPYSELSDENAVDVVLPTHTTCGEAKVLPQQNYSCTVADLKTESFKRFQRGAAAIVNYSQPDNRFANIQIAELPRFVPAIDADNKPMPEAQNLYYFMNDDFKTINRIYGLLSKSYDPAGDHLEVLVKASSSSVCQTIGGIGTAEDLDNPVTDTINSVSVSVDCRLSNTWRARTAVAPTNDALPNIREIYDINNKSGYSGARASVTTTEEGTIFVFADGSFRYNELPDDFNDGNAHTDSFYYAVQTEDTANGRISDIKKVYIGYNIANTIPTGVSFKEAGGTSITNLQDFDIAEDAKKDLTVGEIYASDTDEPDDNDFVRFNLGQVPIDDPDIDVDHGARFRIDQKDEKFYLVLNSATKEQNTSIRWNQLPEDKKYFAIRIIATDLRGNQLATTQKVYVDRVDCSETAMENIKIYKTKAAMTIEGFIIAAAGEKVFKRQTVPFTSNLDQATITFDFVERSVQPSIKISEQTITLGEETATIGMLSNRCKNSHDYIDRQQLWSNE